MNQRRIIHLDMDAFFASIEERDNPELKGKPVVVGSPPNVRGVVSTCNYIARKYGIHSAMSSTEAYRRCPNAIFITPHFSKYKEASEQVHKLMARYTDKIEFVALDEGYMDVTGSELLFGSAEEIAKELQRDVFETVGTTCSVGIGYSMMSAKCASEEKKPRGFFVISSPESFFELMKDRPVGELYGVGAKTAERLSLMGIKTVGALAKTSYERLASFGKFGAELKERAMGTDNREVISNAPPKSIGRETTFLKDTSDKILLDDTLTLLAGDISFRLFSKGLWGRTVTLKIKYSDMKSITRSRSGECVRASDELYKIGVEMLKEQPLSKSVRLIGMSVSNLTDTPFFQIAFDESEKNTALSNTVFDIKNKFGKRLIRTAKEIAAEKRLSDEYEKK